MNKKNLIIIGIIVFIISMICGELLIEKGINQVLATKTRIQVESNNKNISNLESKKEELITQEKTLIQEQTEEFSTNGESDKYKEISSKLTKISEDKKEIDFEISKYKNGYYDNNAGLNQSIFSGMVYVIPGVLVFIIGIVILIGMIKKFKSK